MERLEKVELVRERCGVDYASAKEALEATGYDALDAIIWLERAGRSRTSAAHYSTEAASADPTPSHEMATAQRDYARRSRKSRLGELACDLMRWVGRACRAGLDSSFVAERRGEHVLAMPVLVLAILVLLAWPAALPLLVVGLFFGFRYRFEGIGTVTVDVNDAMDRAADGAERISRDIRQGLSDE